MFDVVLGLGSAASFSASNVVSRRGLLHASSNFIANISICSGPLFFLAATLISGDLQRIAGYSWKPYVYFAAYGLIHFALGRTYSFRSTQLLGSTRSQTIIGLNVIVTSALAVAILGEAINARILSGILLSLAGPLLVTLKGASKGNPQSKAASPGHVVVRKNLYTGMLYGLGAAILWGVSPIFIKLGLEAGGSPVGGTLIAYVAATVVISPWAFNGESRTELAKPGKKALQFALGSGMASNTAQLLRFLALSYGSVIVVSLMGRTGPIWTMLLAFIFNRKYESFSRWIILGNALLLVGTVIVLV